MYTLDVKVPYIDSSARKAAYKALGPAAADYVYIPLINTPEHAKSVARNKFDEDHYYSTKYLKDISDVQLDVSGRVYHMTLQVYGD